MSVRFKFKNDLDYQPIPCDGFHISVRDLKKSIIRLKKFGKVTDFDLVVTNSQTSHIYLDDKELISKNTTLTVQRAPLGEGKKKVWEDETSVSASNALASHTTTFASIPGLNLSQTNLDSEEDKISKMMSNSSEMYSEKHWTKFKGQKALPDGSKPPPHWKCSKCLANHWVSDCPFANNDMKRTTGIPRSFLKPAESNVPGAKINPQGLIVINEMEKLAYSEKKIEKNPWLPDEKPAVTKVIVPTELLCPICSDLLKDAVMMPCCAGSACDECARNGIIDSEGSRCPVCTDVANPEELIPYRLFRDKVDKFRNQTGYTKAAPPPPTQTPLSTKPTLPDIVLPDPADVNFKFDSLVGHRPPTQVKVEPPNLNFSLKTTTYGSPHLTSQATSESPATGSPHGATPPRQHLPPHTPTSTPPRSPGTPTSSPQRSRSPSKRSRSPGTPCSRHNGFNNNGRGTPTPTTSPQQTQAPLVDTSVPPPMFAGAPGPTLLPPGHVLAPTSHYPPPPPQLAPAPPHYHPQPLINPSEDPLAAFEAAMRKLDSKKASRGRLGPSSPPRAYRVERPRSRSRERYREYHEREYSPRRRSPGGYRGYSPRRGMSPRRLDRGQSRGSGPRTPSPSGDSRHSLLREGRTASPGSGRDYRGDSHGSLGARQRKERYVTDIPPETEEERRERERFEREMAERERYQTDKERDDQYSNFKRVERSKGRVAPTPPREFLEREKGTEYREREGDNRTPSLSPEPGTDQHKEYISRQEEKHGDARDKDIRVKDVDARSYKDERSSRTRDDERENIDPNVEGDKENTKDRDVKDKDYEIQREENDKDYGRHRDVNDKDYGRQRHEKDKDYVRQGEEDTDRYRERDGKESRDDWDKDVKKPTDNRDYERSRGETERSKHHEHSEWDRSRDRGKERSRDRDIQDRSRDRDIRGRSRDRDIRGRSRDRDIRGRSRDRDIRARSRDRDIRGTSRDRDIRGRSRERQDRSRDRLDRSRERHDRSRDRQDRSKERQDEYSGRRGRSRENYGHDHAEDKKEERNGHREVSESKEHENKQDEKKESKKEKKAKKSKKKSKKKDKDSDSDENGKENKKKKKKGKKNKDRDHDSNEEQINEDEVKPLVPYGEAEDTKTVEEINNTDDIKDNEEGKTIEESTENQEIKQQVDPTKFVNSFSEASVDDNKPKLKLPTLVFNDKTVELAPKENISSDDKNNEILPNTKTETENKLEFSSSSKSNTDTNSQRHEKVGEIKREKKSIDVTKECGDKKLIQSETIPSVSSKWDREDILTLEYPGVDKKIVNEIVPAAIIEEQIFSKSINPETTSGPQNVLRKALANMEKDNLVIDKKRKSLEMSEQENGEDSLSKKKKKKKKKKVETEEESSEEETKEKTKKKTKKKKKGGLEIPEKTLKKLLKKNLLKKKALEKLISGDVKKKKKKKRYSGEASDLENKEAGQSSSEETSNKKSEKNESARERKRSKSKERKSRVSIEERIVRRRDSHSAERKVESKISRKGNKRDTSEEGREVKSSREGNIQVRLDNSSRLGGSSAESRHSLTSTVQANLLKLAGQVNNGREEQERERGTARGRESPPRKSIKDRLGPCSGRDSSPVKRGRSKSKEERVVRRAAALLAVKDRLGGSKVSDGCFSNDYILGCRREEARREKAVA